MSVIAFNLIMTAAFTGVKLNDNPQLVGEFIGGSGDVSGGKHLLLIISIEYRRLCHLSAYGLQLLS